MTTKEDEIRAIRELVAMNGYFADAFSADIDKIEDNIKKDFPLLSGVSTNHELALQHKAREKEGIIFQLCGELLDLSYEIKSDPEYFEKIVISKIGRLETIKLKEKRNLHLTRDDVAYLINCIENL
jgi:hypothetical protein